MTFGAAPPSRRARIASAAGNASVSAIAVRCGAAKVVKPVPGMPQGRSRDIR